MVDRALVATHVRRLDAATQAAVVADCWAAAGHTVERGGTTVRVRRAGHERRLSTVPDADADRVLDADAVCDALLYRVARRDADRIATRHLGAPLGDLRPPLARRATRAARAWGTPVAVVVVVAGVVALGLAGAAVGDGTAGADTAGVTSDAPASERSIPKPTGAPGAAVPGLGRSGVTDLAALAAAHERARPESYGVWVDFERTGPDAETVARDVDLRVEEGRYAAAVRVERGEEVTREATVYGDGTWRVVGTERNGTVSLREIGPTETGPARVDPDALGAEGVRRWLAAPETRVAGVEERDGERVYRVVGVGAPPTVEGDVESYRVRALVTEDGVVVELVAEYVLAGAERPARRFEWSYARGPRQVDVPKWTGLNATETGRGD
ncbi:MAG: hypothetical protein ABEJ34_07930 [Haloferacaceae archaeon]